MADPGFDWLNPPQLAREYRRMMREERAFTEACRAEEQATTAALINELRERQ